MTNLDLSKRERLVERLLLHADSWSELILSIRVIWSDEAIKSVGSRKKPDGPATSVIGGLADVKTGQPQDMASKIGQPKPSEIEGKRNREAKEYKAFS